MSHPREIIHLPNNHPALFGWLVQYDERLYKIIGWDETSITCKRVTNGEFEALRASVEAILHERDERAAFIHSQVDPQE